MPTHILRFDPSHGKPRSARTLRKKSVSKPPLPSTIPHPHIRWWPPTPAEVPVDPWVAEQTRLREANEVRVASEIDGPLRLALVADGVAPNFGSGVAARRFGSMYLIRETLDRLGSHPRVFEAIGWAEDRLAKVGGIEGEPRLATVVRRLEAVAVQLSDERRRTIGVTAG